MRIIAVVLVCLACACHGRRVSKKTGRTYENWNAEHQKLQQNINAADLHHIGFNSKTASSDRQLEAVSPLEALALRLLAPSKPSAGYHAMGSAHSQFSLQRRPVHRLGSVMATDSASEKEEAERKRLKAERLALEAERAALQAEELELKMAKLRLKQQKNQANQAVEEVPPIPAPAPVSSVASSSTNTAPTNSALPSQPPLPTLPDSPAQNTSDSQLALGGPVSNFAKMFGFEEAGLQQLSATQVEVAKEKVFDLNTFYVTQVEQTFIGTVFRGNLRSNSSVVFERVTSKLAEVPELREFSFMLMEDPVPPPPGGDSNERLPVFVVLPKKNTEREQVFPELVVTFFGLGISILTSLGFSLTTYILSDGDNFIKAIKAGDFSPSTVSVPVVVGIGVLALFHEVGHIAAAQKYDLKIGIPTVLPSLQLGTFGTITKLLEFPKNRTALFDFALSGPALGGGLSLLFYFAGLLFSTNLPPPPVSSQAQATELITAISNAIAQPGIAPVDATPIYVPPDPLNPVAPTSLLRSSYLLGSIASLLLPSINTAPFVSVHPLVVIGFCGTVINALQLLPIGRLDGGRLATAMFGQNRANLLTSLSIVLLGLTTIFGGDNPTIFFFGLFTILFQRNPENPCIDEITPVDSKREAFATIALAIALLVIFPVPAGPAPPSSGGFF